MAGAFCPAGLWFSRGRCADGLYNRRDRYLHALSHRDKNTGQRGPRILCPHDGCGAHFELLSCVGDEPEGFAIMPASLCLASGRILSTRRMRLGNRKQAQDEEDNWIDLYGSDDDGQTWALIDARVAATGTGGNPPTLTMLEDGPSGLGHYARSALRAGWRTGDCSRSQRAGGICRCCRCGEYALGSGC